MLAHPLTHRSRTAAPLGARASPVSLMGRAWVGAPTAHRMVALARTPCDLRRVLAALTQGADGDIHMIEETLRNPTITLTSHTYTSLLAEVDHPAAEAAAALIPRLR